MCSHYQAVKEQNKYRRHFGVEPPADMGKLDLWPGYVGTFIRRHAQADVGDEAVPEREALCGLCGLVPHWSHDTQIARHTYNARSETVAAKPSFRDAWKRAQHCVIPADAFFEPDWRSGKAVATRITRTDGEPMGIAGLWAAWKSPKGELMYSYTMLTINADAHPLMRLFQSRGIAPIGRSLRCRRLLRCQRVGFSPPVCLPSADPCGQDCPSFSVLTSLPKMTRRRCPCRSMPMPMPTLPKRYSLSSYSLTKLYSHSKMPSLPMRDASAMCSPPQCGSSAVQNCLLRSCGAL